MKDGEGTFFWNLYSRAVKRIVHLVSLISSLTYCYPVCVLLVFSEETSGKSVNDRSPEKMGIFIHFLWLGREANNTMENSVRNY